MSSNDQAFVKAFSRRNRPERSGRPQATADVEKQVVAPVPEIQRIQRPASEPGSLTVDQSVADSTQVWVDPIEDQVVRADVSTTDVPKPHLDLASPQAPERKPSTPNDDQPVVRSLQHIHTAYATSYTDVSPVSLPQRVPTEAERMPRETTPAPETVPAEEVPDVTQFAKEETPEVAPVVEHVVETSPLPTEEYAPFQSAWEVDVFDVPTNVADLFFEGKLFQQIADRMSEAVASGLKTVLVTSTASGEGRSSVAIGMAMAAAAAGIHVALVDADTADPTLANDLRLDLEYGWVDTIRGGLPIREVAVHAVDDGVTLIPLMPPHGRTEATPFEVIQLIDLLKNKFELVIIDGPAGTSTGLHQCASAVDSAIIVRDTTSTGTLAISEFSYRLQEAGVSGVGVVENFA
ncbi:MAG: cellulose synthase operon protein YhjQ/BcsQ [Rubripirellula sp.]